MWSGRSESQASNRPRMPRSPVPASRHSAPSPTHAARCASGRRRNEDSAPARAGTGVAPALALGHELRDLLVIRIAGSVWKMEPFEGPQRLGAATLPILKMHPGSVSALIARVIASSHLPVMLTVAPDHIVVWAL